MRRAHMEPNILELILDGRREPTNLPLHLLQEITKQFSPKQKIGSGGFGVVYKGLLQNGTVAVKKAAFTTPTTQDDQFNREANNLMMMRVKHQNVVRFLGYCSVIENRFEQIQGALVRYQIWERLLCFEYISNGSLRKYITGELSGLEWHTRYQIIRGICEGLRYLHEKKHMIHRDLKPENILLDDQMVPKIADFGVSKLLDGVSKAITSNRSLSMWYCDPEFIEHGEVSSKLDIYSLGVIIIEVVTGRRECPDVKKVLRRWRYRWSSKSANRTPLQMGYQQVARCVEIGLLCKEKDPKKRPNISKIIGYLNQVDNLDDNTYKSTIGQIISCWNQLVWIEPLELFFPFEINKNISCSLELTNETDAYIAFNIQTTRPLWSMQPAGKGIVAPRSKCSISVTLQAQKNAPEDMQYADEFVVKSTKVNEGVIAEDITEEIFSKESGNVVEEVNLDAVFDAQLLQCMLLEESKDNNNLSLAPLVINGTRNLKASASSQITSLAAHDELIQVEPLELSFPSEQKVGDTSLKISNITDDYVAFHLAPRGVVKAKYNTIPLPRGVLLPHSEVKLVVTRVAREADVDVDCMEVLVVQSTVVSEDLKTSDVTDDMFGTHEGQMVHEVELRVVLVTPCQPKSSEVISDMKPVWHMDVHPTEPWIVTATGDPDVRIWNYQTKEVKSVELGMLQGIHVKFVVRKQWVVAGATDGQIYVYGYDLVERVRVLRAHKGPVRSLAIHATEPYMLSASDDGTIMLWDYENEWELMRTFDAKKRAVHRVAFNPRDTNIFASAQVNLVKIWDVHSEECKDEIVAHHSSYVYCLDYFFHEDNLYLITCLADHTAKVWDCTTWTCVQMLQGHMDVVGTTLCDPELPVLITGSDDGSVCLWDSKTFRLKSILNFDLGEVNVIARLKGSRRIAIGYDNGLVLADIDAEESNESYSEGTEQK